MSAWDGASGHVWLRGLAAVAESTESWAAWVGRRLVVCNIHEQPVGVSSIGKNLRTCV